MSFQIREPLLRGWALERWAAWTMPIAVDMLAALVVPHQSTSSWTHSLQRLPAWP